MLILIIIIYKCWHYTIDDISACKVFRLYQYTHGYLCYISIHMGIHVILVYTWVSVLYQYTHGYLLYQYTHGHPCYISIHMGIHVILVYTWASMVYQNMQHLCYISIHMDIHVILVYIWISMLYQYIVYTIVFWVKDQAWVKAYPVPSPPLRNFQVCFLLYFNVWHKANLPV